MLPTTMIIVIAFDVYSTDELFASEKYNLSVLPPWEPFLRAQLIVTENQAWPVLHFITYHSLLRTQCAKVPHDVLVGTILAQIRWPSRPARRVSFTALDQQ